jgi:hypothetical protein
MLQQHLSLYLDKLVASEVLKRMQTPKVVVAAVAAVAAVFDVTCAIASVDFECVVVPASPTLASV